jgi:hypothetical protein
MRNYFFQSHFLIGQLTLTHILNVHANKKSLYRLCNACKAYRFCQTPNQETWPSHAGHEALKHLCSMTDEHITILARSSRLYRRALIVQHLLVERESLHTTLFSRQASYRFGSTTIYRCRHRNLSYCQCNFILEPNMISLCHFEKIKLNPYQKMIPGAQHEPDSPRRAARP